MIWDIQEKSETDPDKEWGVPKKVLKGKDFSGKIQFLIRPFSLYQRFESFSRQQILFDRFMGRNSSFVGLEKRINH